MSANHEMTKEQKRQLRRKRSENSWLDVLFLIGDLILYIPRLIYLLIRSIW